MRPKSPCTLVVSLSNHEPAKWLALRQAQDERCIDPLFAGDQVNGMPIPHEPALTPAGEALTRPFSELQRYAGWLSKDHVSVAVRADVHALGAAIDAGHDASASMVTLDKDIARMPSGDIRKMLRKALAEIRAVLEPGDV